jgi:hypothetical protein
MPPKHQRVKPDDEGKCAVIDEHQAFRLEAQRAGLSRLLETRWAELEKAKASAERLISGIPRGLHMYDEPAHIFRAVQRREHD